MAVSSEWVTLAEASEQLGVSVHALRRRIKSGAIVARQVSTRHGPAWEVCLDPDATVAVVLRDPNAGLAPPRRDPDANGVPELVALVDKLTQQNLELAGRVGFYQARVQELESRVLMLEAPKAVEPAPVVEATPDPAVRSWWRRLFG